MCGVPVRTLAGRTVNGRWKYQKADTEAFYQFYNGDFGNVG